MDNFPPSMALTTPRSPWWSPDLSRTLSPSSVFNGLPLAQLIAVILFDQFSSVNRGRLLLRASTPHLSDVVVSPPKQRVARVGKRGVLTSPSCLLREKHWRYPVFPLPPSLYSPELHAAGA